MDSKVVTIGERLAMELGAASRGEPAPEPVPGIAGGREASQEASQTPGAPEVQGPNDGVVAQDTTKRTPQRAPADIDQRMGKLQDQSRKLQSEREMLKSERAKLEADLRELAQLRELKARAKEDPVAWAEAGGYEAPDAYATALMEKGTLTPERRRVLELEKQTRDQATRLDRMDAERAEYEQKQMQTQVMGQLRQFGTQNAEKYDLVNRLGAHDNVMGVIQQHFQATIDPDSGVGEVMTYDQAYQIVEDWLDKQLSPALESPKIRARLGAAAAGSTPVRPSTSTAPRQPVGTVSRTRATSAPERPQTEAERLQSAGEYLFAQLRGRNR